MGKSTTLKSIMGLLKPKSGQVVFNGKEITGQAPYKIAKAGIGYVPEERRIFPTLSVLDNLMMGVKGGQINTSDPDAWTIDKIFDHFPFMKERTHQKGAHLSGGEQQMLTIGRTLMGNPRLLMVDEPTEGLSPIMVKEGARRIEKDLQIGDRHLAGGAQPESGHVGGPSCLPDGKGPPGLFRYRRRARGRSRCQGEVFGSVTYKTIQIDQSQMALPDLSVSQV